MADANENEDSGEVDVFFDATGVPIVETPEQRTLRIHWDKLQSDYRYNACTSCALHPVLYREVQNVGSLTCRYHPGPLIGGTYTCCGWAPMISYDIDGTPLGRGLRVSLNQYGCVPCDHTPACVNVGAGPGFAQPVRVEQPVAGEKNARWTQANIITRIPLGLLAYYKPEKDTILHTRVNKDAPERSYAIVLRVDPRWANKI